MMRLKAVKKTEPEEPKKIDRCRLGRRSKNKGSAFERVVAKKIKEAYNEEFMRTPQSGGFARNNAKAEDFRGDVVPIDKNIDSVLHIEAKNAKNWYLPSWLKQAENDCPEGKIPVVVFHQHGTSKNYITLSFEDFLKLIPKESVIIRKE